MKQAVSKNDDSGGETVSSGPTSPDSGSSRSPRRANEADTLETETPGGAGRHEEPFYRQLVENVNSIILCMDTRGVVTYINDFGCTFFGFAPGELVGLNVVGSIVPLSDDSGTDLRALMLDIAKRPERHTSNENENMRKDGRRVWVAWSNRGIRNEDGTVREVICVGNDITERKRVEDALTESRQRLRGVTERLETVREEERRCIAHEIHDHLGHELTGLKYQASLTLRILERLDTPRARGAIEKVRDIIASIDAAVRFVRRLATELRPPVLDLGMVAAMEWLCREFKRKTDLDVSFESIGDYQRMDKGLSITFFRTLQELLTNVARHANARKVRVCLRARADRLVLQVWDDGRGIDSAHSLSDRSAGLAGIRERLHMLKGAMRVDSRTGAGTRVTIRLPLPGEDTDGEFAGTRR